MSRSRRLLIIAVLPATLLGALLGMILLLGPAESAEADCGPVSVVVDGNTRVNGYAEEQLKNAAAVMGAGKALNLSAKGQTITIMVALGESGLRVLDYGDGPGPDSRGLFQQRDNGAWGSYADRMDPTISATYFIKALQAVPDWEQLEPTIAGNKVQRNADPYHYQKYWAEAVKIVQALSDGKFSLEGSDCAIPGKSGAGDDYPWKDSPTWQQVGAGSAAAASPLGMFYRECVDFALWRVNQQMGSTSAPFKFLNGSFRPDGQGLGSAVTWKAGWDAKGWPTGKTPRIGAVVWYAPGIGGSDPTFGHVAVVKEVKDDGTYVEEGYNGNPPPDDHNYYTRTVSSSAPSAFLYLPNQEEKK
ncbi:CHAP domain-containing protein [Paenarthrobacter aromaticivorans]|uniref:CHAP domain-containing protein n=1 Tax=Paenarthrobacter aromaticivorans TaxID=2849150 RepID=A0ABS6IAK3_9MICC|nr:CHAP domain-containing protein [Paenarthrobacter sp. MMS21-TAE1-1]MBU8867876.1 CHAP domain-containing protein [Paenarthrobacter sp. MMS21-TAE1-1]